MVKRDTIIAALDKYLKVSLFTDYAPIGLQVQGAPEVMKIVTGVSLNMDFLREAVRSGAQMVLVHHGMFWKDESPVLKGAKKTRVAFLLENDLTLAAYHLPLDAHSVVGNNAQIIKMLGIKAKKPFGEYKGFKLGFTGAFEKPMTIGRILELLKPLSPDGSYYFPGRRNRIRRIAVVSGGAGSLFEQAIEEGVDLYITGSSWEPALALARECGVGFLAIGHHNSEKPGVIALGGWLKGRFKVAVEFVDVPNPA